VRQLQVTLFVLALVAFIAALFVTGTEMGDILWRGGVAVLLLDLVCIKLWPASPASARSTGVA